MLPLVLALVAPDATAMTLEEAWTAVENRGQEGTFVEEQRRQAALVRTQALAAFSPKVNLGGNYTVNQREVKLDFGSSFPPEMIDLIEQFTGSAPDFGEPRVIQRKSYLDANLTVVQPILSARAIPGWVAANAMARAGDAQADAARGTLRAGVARAYWAVVVARDGAAVAKAAQEIAQRHETQVQALVTAGSATRQAALQAAMAVARAERERAAAETRRTQAETAFASLVSASPDVELALPVPRTLPWSGVEAALEDARAHRPELSAASEQQRAARATLTASHLAWLPTVDGRFMQLWSENTGFNGEPWNWMAVANASWSLWDGGFRVAEEQRAASQARVADAAAAKAWEDAEIEIRTAWEEHDRARRAEDAATRELALAEENLRLAEASHAAGASTFLELDDARLARDAARLARMAERMGADLAALGLLRAAGRL
jgi:outer membrane protein TolC